MGRVWTEPRYWTRVVAVFATSVLGVGIASGEVELYSTLDQPSGRSYHTQEATVDTSEFPRDFEVADDFNVNGQVERIYIQGRGPCYCPQPLTSIILRFYTDFGAAPGALLAEYVIPADSPNLNYDPNWLGELDITLPTPFQASGSHFVSIQAAFDGAGYYVVEQGNLENPVGASIWQQDRLAGTGWEPATAFSGDPLNSDFVMAIYGTPGAADPFINAVSRSVVPRSGRIVVEGTAFGGPAESQLLVDGHPAITVEWSDTQIIGYVPEAASAGLVDLVVEKSGTPSTPMTIEVTPRQLQGNVRWRFEFQSDFTSHRSGVRDGRVYVNDIDGRLWALTEDGALLWIADTLRGQEGTGNEGPVDVGADGTIYVGANPLGPDVDLVAYNPDGTIKWVYTASALAFQAGPNVGPDGNVYAAMVLGGDQDAFSLTPDGTERWRSGADPLVFDDDPLGSELVFGPSQPGGEIDRVYFVADQDFPSVVYAFDMATGNQAFSKTVEMTDTYLQQQSFELGINQQSGALYVSHFSSAGGWRLRELLPSGNFGWTFDPDIASEISAANVGPDGSIYFSWDISRIGKVSPDGTEVWRIIEPGALGEGPICSPNGDLLLIGGVDNFGQPGFFRAFDTASGSLLWEEYLGEERGGQIVPNSRAKFNDSGSTAYFAATLLGDSPTGTYSFLYALKTGENLLAGDIDQSGTVNNADLGILLAGYLQCVGDAGYNPGADLSGDGCVNNVDLGILLANYLQSN